MGTISGVATDGAVAGELELLVSVDPADEAVETEDADPGLANLPRMLPNTFLSICTRE